MQASRHIAFYKDCAKIKSMDATAIITTTITAVATTFVAVMNVWMNSQRKKDKEEAKAMAERNAAKSAILNMITQDIIRVEVLKKSPENYQAILKEYDWYTKNGGNSYIKAKVKDYLEWQEKAK
jgi:Na+-translocating ferredoxin:NAD+ oxidoreductase RnfG subunit